MFANEAIQSNALDFASTTFGAVAATAALASLTLSLIAATLALIKNRQAGAKLQEYIRHLPNSEAQPANAQDTEPFERTALASYYKQALSRATISFWFSITFASIGFGVIIFAFLSHSSNDSVGTIIKVSSGAIIDAISALFFVQSTNAQKAMGEFFEKLRTDRLNVEARDMIAEIENIDMRDQLRSQLILKYSGIDRLLVGAHQSANG